MIKECMGSHIRMSGIQILVQKLYEISETAKSYASEPLSYKMGNYYLPNRLWIRNNTHQ